MSGLSYEIEGLDELKRRLEQLSSGLRTSILSKAVRAAALPIQNAAKQNAPVLTGTLRRSIHTKVQLDGVGAVARVGTDVPYARRIEYGFQDTDALGRTYHQPARPYLRKALDEKRGEALNEAAAVIRDLLEKAGV